MIGTALNYIRQQLDDHLRVEQEPDSEPDTEERVVFLEGDKLDPLSLPQRRISMLVVNVQEDREFRDSDRYLRRIPQGHGQQSRYERHFPDLHLEFTVLFVAQFEDYVYAWNQLGQLLLYLQEHPIFENVEGLEKPFRRLTHELLSSSLQQQNDVWSALKISMRPAVLYRFRLITLTSGPAVVQPKPVERISTSLTVAKELPINGISIPINPQQIPTNLRSPPPLKPTP